MKKEFIVYLVLIIVLSFTTMSGQKSYKSGIEPENMDKKVSPKEDFYNFVNGGWQARTEIPDDESRWGSFNELRKKNHLMTLALVDKALADEDIDPNTDEGKVVKFFKTAMNTDKLDEDGIKSLALFLFWIDKIYSIEDVVKFTVAMEPYIPGLWGISIHSDLKNSNYNTLYLGGGALGLPDREYYLSDKKEILEKRQKYMEHVARMFRFLGESEESSFEIAVDILKFETKIAESKLPKEELRDPSKIYNPMTVNEISNLVPLVNWEKYFSGIGAKNFEKVVVYQPKYLKQLQKLLQDEPISVIKNYLRWTMFNDASKYLTTEIENARFDFYGKVMSGTKKQKPRNERVLSTTNSVLGEALGKLYVKEYFPPAAKDVAKEMVENIREAFKLRINNLDWMSDETKEKALEKLARFKVKIGYPDVWKDYSGLLVKSWDDDGSFYKNVLNARHWNFEQDIDKIGKEVDRNEWFMAPQSVNAYYYPPYNEIVFPAAILQTPFFNFQADPACNYGGIGAVIGHEMSHGFDDKGSKFDADGNLNNWWTDEDRELFKAKGKKLVDQFNAYFPFPDLHVNGEFTLGENIGDLCGVEVAYDGLSLYLSKGNDVGEIDGFTQTQRFFINWAVLWKSKIRDEALRQQIATDPHSPGYYRAIGPLENVDEFFEAFDIKEGNKMYKSSDKRVKIW